MFQCFCVSCFNVSAFPFVEWKSRNIGHTDRLSM
jgi:hypothetical protein